jgi:hypothetical protein
MSQEDSQRNDHFPGKTHSFNVRAADAKEVGVGNPAEETYCHPDKYTLFHPPAVCQHVIAEIIDTAASCRFVQPAIDRDSAVLRLPRPRTDSASFDAEGSLADSDIGQSLPTGMSATRQTGMSALLNTYTAPSRCGPGRPALRRLNRRSGGRSPNAADCMSELPRNGGMPNMLQPDLRSRVIASAWLITQ